MSDPRRNQTFHLKRACTLSRAVDEGPCLSVVYGGGGGCTLDWNGGVSAVWIPLHGCLQVQCAGLGWNVYTGEALVTEYDASVRAVGHADGRWLALLGSKRVWEQVLSPGTAARATLLPDLYKADRELRRLAIAVVRATQPAQLDGAMNALMDRLDVLQAPLREAIARCPGRTWANKRQVFMRLQRVHNYVCACCDQELDVDMLARMANYSPCHFLRIFHLVYQTTPHAYLVDRRLQRARRLLHASSLTVTEVAVACGFENRGAFSRLFHRHFGMTAQEVMLQSRTPAPALEQIAA